MLEFDVDDMTGEEIAVAADRLRAEPGVIDVSVGTRQGKKGRPLAEFRVLARPDAADAIARACFTETSTLGLRVRDERRRVLRRAEVDSGGRGRGDRGQGRRASRRRAHGQGRAGRRCRDAGARARAGERARRAARDALLKDGRTR